MHLNAWHVVFNTSEVSTRSLPGWLEGSIKPGNMKAINSPKKKKTWHSKFLLLGAVEWSTSSLLLWPVKLRQLRNDHVWFISWGNDSSPQNENRVTVHPHMLVKTTPEFWRLIEQALVSLCSSMSACWTIRVGTSTFMWLQKTQTSIRSVRGLCAILLQLRNTGNMLYKLFGEGCVGSKRETLVTPTLWTRLKHLNNNENRLISIKFRTDIHPSGAQRVKYLPWLFLLCSHWVKMYICH